MGNKKVRTTEKSMCKHCFHCRMKIKVNKKNPLETVLSPWRPARIFCRKNWWLDKDVYTKEYKMLRTVLGSTFKEGHNCPKFMGEEGEVWS